MDTTERQARYKMQSVCIEVTDSDARAARGMGFRFGESQGRHYEEVSWAEVVDGFNRFMQRPVSPRQGQNVVKTVTTFVPCSSFDVVCFASSAPSSVKPFQLQQHSARHHQLLEVFCSKAAISTEISQDPKMVLHCPYSCHIRSALVLRRSRLECCFSNKSIEKRPSSYRCQW